MNKAQLNLQDTFLNQARKENVPVTIYLVNSVQLRGNVRGFDSFTILLDSPGKPPQLVYKHSITSIVPMRPIQHLHDSLRENSAQLQAAAADRVHASPALSVEPPKPNPVPDVPPALNVEPIS